MEILWMITTWCKLIEVVISIAFVLTTPSGCIRQILIVAMVAPSIIISSMTNHLSKDKELQNRLRNDNKLLPAAIEEFIRLYVPYRGFSRTALHEVEISGTKVPPDEVCFYLLRYHQQDII